MALACAAVVGCAVNPPLAAVDGAEAEIAAAAEARAARHAPTELERAERLLAAARTALEERRHADAERLSERAGIEAEMARALSRRAVLRDEVERKQAENFDLRRRLMATEADR